MGENRQANQQAKTGTDLGKILADFLDEGRSRKLLGGPGACSTLKYFGFLSHSASHWPLASSLLHG